MKTSYADLLDALHKAPNRTCITKVIQPNATYLYRINEATHPFSGTPDSALFYPVFGTPSPGTRYAREVVNRMRTPNFMLKYIAGQVHVVA